MVNHIVIYRRLSRKILKNFNKMNFLRDGKEEFSRVSR